MSTSLSMAQSPGAKKQAPPSNLPTKETGEGQDKDDADHEPEDKKDK